MNQAGLPVEGVTVLASRQSEGFEDASDSGSTSGLRLLDLLRGVPQGPAEIPVARVTTTRGGNFAFLRLTPGTYVLRVVLPSGEILSATAQVGGDEAFLLLQPPHSATNPAEPAARAGALELPEQSWQSAEALSSDGADAVTADASPGDRADTPREDEQHATDAPQVGGAMVGLSYTGQSPGENVQNLDGLSMAQSYRPGARGSTAGGPVSGSSFAEGAIRSLRVRPGSFSATAGHGSGALLAIGSRAGDRHLHGAASATVRLSALAAANPYAVVSHYQDGVITNTEVKPQDTRTQINARIGFAPFRRAELRDRIVLFGSLEARLRQAPVESTPASASFYVLSATQRALLGTRGVGTASTNAALDYLDSLSGEIPRTESRLLSFARVDFKASRRDSLAVTFAGNRFRSPAGSDFDQIADATVARGRGSVGDSSITVQAVAGHWLHAFSPRADNAVRVQWVHDLESETPRAPLAGEPAISPGGEAPEVEIAPFGFTYGTSANLVRSAFPDEHRVQVADLTRWALRGHVLTLGGDWSRIADRIDSLANRNGTFLYDSGTTNGRAGGLVDWITDYRFGVNAYPNGACPSITAADHLFCFRTYTQSFGGSQTAFVTHDLAGFAEDAFHAGPSLGITLGLRYEYTLLPLATSPNPALDAALAALPSTTLPPPLRGATARFPEDANNMAARLGVTWAPRGGRFATVRLGYGGFFGKLPGTTVRAALDQTASPTSAASIERVRITPATEVACPQVPNQGFGFPCAFASTPTGAVLQTSSAMFFSDRFRLPAIQRATLAVEMPLGRHVALEMGYEGAIATQLPTSADVNIAPATGTAAFTIQGGTNVPGLASGRTFVVPLYTARRLTGYGPVTAIVSDANATYHAGTFRASLRQWRGLQVRGGVTFSRALDYNPQSGATPRVNGSFDPFAIGYDKGLSDLQAPLRFAGDAVWRVEVERGAPALRALLNGWDLATTARASSGAPYSYQIFGGTRLSGGHDSINGSGGATYLPTVGRNTLRLPARANVDLRLERGVELRRGMRLSGFAEAFNLLNHRNLSRVETRAFVLGTASGGTTPLIFQDAATVAAEGITTPAFGTPTSSTNGLSRERQFELGLRLTF